FEWCVGGQFGMAATDRSHPAAFVRGEPEARRDRTWRNDLLMDVHEHASRRDEGLPRHLLRRDRGRCLSGGLPALGRCLVDGRRAFYRDQRLEPIGGPPTL